MVFFRRGKSERSHQERADSPSNEPTGSTSTAAAGAPGAVVSATSSEVKEKPEKKKKPKEGQEGSGAGAPTGETRGSAGPARAQAGLSVNDFISKTKNQQRQGLKPSGPELIAYARYLGIDAVADHDLLWIAVEALEAPLPSDWTEHFDSNDRVFYYNATTRVSSWTHPLEHIYRETYKTIVNFRNSNMSPPERNQKLHQLQSDVKQMHEDVNKEISQWTEHTDEQGNRFYFNREERQSTWTDPRPAKCQILYLRQKMLRLLESNSGATAGFSDSKGDGMSRFGPISGRPNDFDDPASKRSKAAGAGRMEIDMPDARRSPEGVPSEPGSDSDSGDDKKKKKKKKKKKRDKEGGGAPSAPVRLGAPQKLGTSHSEPSVGCKPLSDASSAGDGSGMGRSPRSNSGAQTGAGAGGAPHPALGGLSPLDESGLSLAGRTRVKAGIRLEPIGPGGPPPEEPAGGRRGVSNSASVPTL